MAKIDPYKHEEKYNRWKQEQQCRIPDVTPQNADLIRRFLHDMELGLNVSRAGKRGPRSFIRLNTLRTRMACLARRFTDRFGLELLTEVSEEQVHTLFNEMRTGVILKQNGQRYLAVSDFAKDFKGFWHWHMEVERRKGTTIEDLTYYLDSRPTKPKWVYLTEEQVKLLCEEAKYEYRVLIMFLLDSGIRSPTELVNVRVSDFQENFAKVHVREEVSKTFGRRINLMLCPELLRSFAAKKGRSETDVLFPICPSVANRYLKRLAKRVLGDGVSLAGERFCNLTLYDFRHISACYWLPRYKSESAMKYRFGWKQTERIHYYTELLGMKDNIAEDDLVLDVEKTQIERRLAESEREKKLLQERLDAMEGQMQRIADLTEQLAQKVG